MKASMSVTSVFSHALAVALAAFVIAGPAAAQAPEAVSQAEALHNEGVRLFQAGRYEEAASAFERAEQLARNPLNLYNRARCAQELGDRETALRWLDRYLATPDVSATDRADAEQLRREIATGSATPPPTTAPNATPPAIDQPPPQQAPPPPSGEPHAASLAGPWAVLGAGLGLLVVGVVLDGVAFGLSAVPEDGFDGFQDYRDWFDAPAYPLALAGDVMTAVGGAMAVAGMVWLLVARSRRAADRAAHAAFSIGAGGPTVRFGFTL